MSKLLAELLGAGEPMFSLALHNLEHASAQTGVDVRLTAELISKRHAVLKALGLDSSDTNAQELYYALLGLARTHDRFLALRLGAQDPTDTDDVLRRIRIATENIAIPKTAWVIKHSALKRLLKKMPPKKVMKALGYRSLDSMLKREPCEVLICAIRMFEMQDWQHKFLSQYTGLRPIDFETREITVVVLDSAKWRKIATPYVQTYRHNIVHAKEVGVVAILPLPVTHLPGVTLSVFPRVLHYMAEIRLYSAYFKLRQVRHDFGHIVANTLKSDPGNHARMAGQEIHWRIIHRHFGHEDRQLLPEMFEPHVQMEDMLWHSATKTLFQLEPALHFWYAMEYAGATVNNHTVSFNLIDMADSALNNLSFDQRLLHHMRQNLWAELHTRYMAQPALQAHVLRQLDTEMIEPALLSLSQKGSI